MRHTFFLVGMTSLVAGQALDLDMINSAPPPIASGPAVTATAETISYAAASIGSAAVTATAAAIANSPVVKRGNVEARTINLSNILCAWFKINCPKPTPSPPVVTPKPNSVPTPTPTPTPTPAVSVAAQPTTSSKMIVTSINTVLPTPTGIPTTCTNTWTNTFEFTSATDCPDIFEVGTYCGFVNPLDPCADQPKGSGPVAVPDTPDAFLANPANKNLALSAIAPSGYAQTFQNLQGSTSAASYLGLTTMTSYDVAGCAALCDKTDTCTSFNMYIERDPTLNPSSTYCCPNPASLSNFKCTLWGSVIDSTTATNTGETRADFKVLITASNGYTKANTTTPVTPTGCSQPTKCSGAHSHPQTCIEQQFFPGPYNPQLCASFAQAQNIKNGATIARGYSSNRCNFFNAYMLKKNGKPLGTYCSLFAQQYNSTQATYFPGWQNGNFYDVETSWSYFLN